MSKLPHKDVLVATSAFFGIFILLGLTTAVTGPTLPALAARTSSRIDQISIIFIAGSLGYLVGSWLGGKGYDKLPGNRIIPAGLLVVAISSIFIPIVNQLSILVILIFILGFAQGTVDVGGNTLLIWMHGSGVGPYMNGLHFFFGVGALLSPFIVAQITKLTNDIQWVYWLFSAIAIPFAVWTWFLKNPERTEKDVSSSKKPINYSVIVMVVFFFVLYVGAELGFGNWIFTYTIALDLAPAAGAAYLTSAYWGFFTLGRMVGIPISMRVSSSKILFVDLVGCLVALGIILVGRQSVEALWVGTIILGLFTASVFPTLMSLAENKLHISGEITGWFLVGSGLGGMLLPWLIGQGFESISPYIMPVLIFIDILLCLVLFFILTRYLNNSKESNTQLPSA